VLRQWFSQYRHALYAYFLRRTRNAADAEDLVQDLFLRLSRFGADPGIRDIEAFMFQIAANLLRDRGRRQLTHPRVVCTLEKIFEPMDGEPGPERVLEARIELSRIMRTLATLPETTRRIFILRRIGQMRREEIAAFYGISLKSVERHVAKALGQLAKAGTRS
jgi:RNA polymerase sigma-70 factor (ECF subfamily)